MTPAAMSSERLVRALLELPYPLFEQEVVRPVLGTLAELLEEMPKLYLLYWPKFSHLPPASLPLEAIADGLLGAFRKEGANAVTREEDSMSLLLGKGTSEEGASERV